MLDNNIIEVTNLSKYFNGIAAVYNLSLHIKKGEIFGFIGANGSGKTTTIRMLCGLITPDSGQGTCLGYDIFTQDSRIKSKIGYVPQAFSLYKDLTVFENLKFIAQTYSLKLPKNKALEIIEELGLNSYHKHLAGNLSGGWKQRLSLAAALIHSPKLLLLDEPTAGVDPKARRDFWNDITRLANGGISSLVSTHYSDEAVRCNRLAYIMNGSLIAKGTPTELMQTSDNPNASFEDVFVELMEKHQENPSC